MPQASHHVAFIPLHAGDFINLSQFQIGVQDKKFSKSLNTILMNLGFRFCLAAESCGQDGAILSDNQPIRLQESMAR